MQPLNQYGAFELKVSVTKSVIKDNKGKKIPAEQASSDPDGNGAHNNSHSRKDGPQELTENDVLSLLRSAKYSVTFAEVSDNSRLSKSESPCKTR